MNDLVLTVCDDDKYIHEQVEELIKEYTEKSGLKIIIEHYYDGESLLSANKKNDIILMDIEMPQMDGIEVSKKINEKFSNANIIILSGIKERFKEAFVIGASRFVTKPIEKNEFFEAIDNVLKKYYFDKKIILNIAGVEQEFYQRDIVMLEADRDYVHIYLENKKFLIRKTLKAIESELDDRIFLSTHRSYIINIMHYSNIDENKVIMKNGMNALISRNNHKILMEKFYDYEMNAG